MSKLCGRKLIAASLMEWTLASTTTFIEAKANIKLIEKAKKIGIELPSPDLAAFETVYCEVDKYNLNRVKFSKEVAEKGLTTLIGKQINWNHDGAHQICGYLIDAEIKDNKIFVTGILFKSLFTSEFDEVVQLFAEKKLFVSFELWTKNEKGESIVKDNGDGFRELTSFVGHGCALLLIDPNTGNPIPPACPQARVQKLLAAEKVIEEAEQIINSVPEKDNSLVYAELATAELLCTQCTKCTCKKEGGEDNIMAEEIINEVEEIEDDYDGGEIEEAKKITTKQRNALPDSDFALIQHKDGKKIRRFPIHDEAHVRNALARLPQAKGLSDAERKSAMAKILRKAKALNMTELLKRHEKACEEAGIEMPVGEVPVKLLDTGKKCKTCMTPLNSEEDGNEYCSLCKDKMKKAEEAHHVEEVTQKPVGEPKKMCKSCNTELTPEEMEGDECALCKNKIKSEPAQVTDPAKEQKPDEQAQVGVTSETAHETVETVTQKPIEEAPVMPPEPKKVLKVVTEETETTTEVPEANGNKTDKKVTWKRTTSYSDGTEEVVTEERNQVSTYSLAQEELIAALPKEVTDCVKKQIKDGKKPAEAVKHCWEEYKKSQEKAMADIAGEKDKLIQEKQTELDARNQELATFKVEKAKVAEQKAEPELSVGNVEVKDNNELKTMANNINKIIASKHDQN